MDFQFPAQPIRWAEAELEADVEYLKDSKLVHLTEPMRQRFCEG